MPFFFLTTERPCVLYLYVITNKVNGKQYVGVTDTPSRRYAQHLCYLGSRVGSMLVHRAAGKYGVTNFTFDVVACGDNAYILSMERCFIDRLRTKAPDGYNLTDGGEGRHGAVVSEASRVRMSEAQKLRQYPADWGSRQRHWLGRTHSSSTRAKMRESALQRATKGLGGKRKAVTVNGQPFMSLKDAAVVLTIPYTNLVSRFRYYRKTQRWPHGWHDGHFEPIA